MKSGVQISIIYTDEHLIRLRVRAANETFAGQADLYANSGSAAEFAGLLRGFPASNADAREFELGTFDPEFAGGGARFQFFCIDATGHLQLVVQLQNRSEGGDITDTATLYIPVEPSAVDSFVLQLESMEELVGQTAVLEGAL